MKKNYFSTHRLIMNILFTSIQLNRKGIWPEFETFHGSTLQNNLRLFRKFLICTHDCIAIFLLCDTMLQDRINTPLTVLQSVVHSSKSN